MSAADRMRTDQTKARRRRETGAAAALAVRDPRGNVGRHDKVRRHHDGRAAAAAPLSGSNVMAKLNANTCPNCGKSADDKIEWAMALDPESQNLLNLMAAANRPAWVTLSPAAAREQYLSTRAGSQGPVPQGVTVSNRPLSGPSGSIAGGLYRPSRAAAEAGPPAVG